jgi:hypothetical protein
MISAGRCDRCGAPAPPSAALDGLCPACLLGAAILVPDSADTGRPGGVPADPRAPGRRALVARLPRRVPGPPGAIRGAQEPGAGAGRARHRGPGGVARRAAPRARAPGDRARLRPDTRCRGPVRRRSREFCRGIPVTRYCEQMEAGAGLREDLRVAGRLGAGARPRARRRPRRPHGHQRPRRSRRARPRAESAGLRARRPGRPRRPRSPTPARTCARSTRSCCNFCSSFLLYRSGAGCVD